MAAVYLVEGRVELLERLRAADSANWRIGLFQSNTTINATDTLATYTLATFSGYAPVAVTWAPAVESSGVGRTQGTVATFVHNGGGVGNTIYGYVVYHVSGKALFAERFAAPKTMNAAGHVITISPAMAEYPI